MCDGNKALNPVFLAVFLNWTEYWLTCFAGILPYAPIFYLPFISHGYGGELFDYSIGHISVATVSSLIYKVAFFLVVPLSC